MAAHFLDPCVRRPDLAWQLADTTGRQDLASTLWPAFDRQSRNRGLLGRNDLPAGTALVLAPCSGVHTWFMRFPIDVVFVGRDGRVLRICRDVGPWRMVWRPGAFATIELAAGASVATCIGHTLRVQPAPLPRLTRPRP